jgi:hypothetical protein
MVGRVSRKGPTKAARAFGAVAFVLALGALPSSVRGQDDYAVTGLTPELEAVKKGLARFEDAGAAGLEAYVAIGCFDYGDYPAIKEEDASTYLKKSGEVLMVNYMQAMSGKLDPKLPAALVYDRPENGPLKLAAAVWMIPYAPGVERPKMFGQDFRGPMVEKSQTPLVRVDFTQYELYAWLWRKNPDGLFMRTNPTLPCITDGYEIRPKALNPGA